MRDPRTLTRAQQKNNTRDQAGVIVTVQERATKHMRTSHHSGLLKDALADACAWIDRINTQTGRTYRIVSISTPRSIAVDVGGRGHIDVRGRLIPTPEQILLGKAGRLDLLERSHTVVVERGPLAKRRGRVRKPAA